MCYLVGPVPTDADTGLIFVILEVRLMLAQDTHWNAGECLLEQVYFLLMYSMVTLSCASAE